MRHPDWRCLHSAPSTIRDLVTIAQYVQTARTDKPYRFGLTDVAAEGTLLTARPFFRKTPIPGRVAAGPNA